MQIQGEGDMMTRQILVLGGSRSGKSIFAESLCPKLGDLIAYIATGEPFDEEMQERIRKHRQQRPSSWRTIEAYRDLSGIDEELDGMNTVMLDSITVYVNNMMYHSKVDVQTASAEQLRELEKHILEDIEAFMQRMNHKGLSLIIVSDEIGMGIIPENKLSRIYRDMVGTVNQQIAARCDEVYLVVSGITISIKGSKE